MVSLGAHFSAVWIVVANSWQQTPAGFHIVGEGLKARAEVTDFWAMVFNPSSMDRLAHALCGGWQAGAWLVVSVSAWYLFKRRHVHFAQRSMRVALAVAMVASVLQLVSGHSSAVGVSKNQPAKLAAFEGHYATEPATLWLFGWVDEKGEKVRFGLGIPRMLTFLVHGDFSTPVTGLREFPPGDRPPVSFVFQTYHAMIGIGMGLIGLAALTNWLIWRKQFFRRRKFMLLLVFSVLGPQLANQFGWWSAEVGRQPWIVYHYLRTPDGLSRVVRAEAVVTSLILFTLVYALLFVCFIYLLNEKIQHGPDEADLTPTGKLAIPSPLDHTPAKEPQGREAY
jgi:cytochrome d ubiquinol oxidase subunit I